MRAPDGFRGKQIIVCYEMIREFVQLHRSYGQAALVPGTMKMSKNKKFVCGGKAERRKSRTQKAFRPERERR